MQQKNTAAYLIIRQGGRWNDVFRLSPSVPLAIGRASNCQIVISDELCSRNHAEIRTHPNGWVVRDLGSRNGTFVNGEQITSEHVLSDGDVIHVSHCAMTFTTSLSNGFRAQVPPRDFPEAADRNTLEHPEPHTITHRSNQAIWLRSADEPTHSRPAGSAPPRSESIARGLFRLAYDLSKESTAESVALTALERLLQMLEATAGGVLRLGKEDRTQPSGKELVLLATSEREGKAYHRVNEFLVQAVMREDQAILARNVDGEQPWVGVSSSFLLNTSSVVLAPIRVESSIVGFIHVYTSCDERTLTSEDLETVLAVAETIGIAWQNVRTKQKLTHRLQESQRELRKLREQLGGSVPLIGNSPALLRVQQQIVRVGPTAATILIRGESGTGKELVARAIHAASPRCNGPFIALNCAALSPTLLESELFGHEKGAFTGATERKIGKFELAFGGTLMLDEIGEMSMEIQAKFLRALENRTFERVGGTKTINADVRVVAATNRDLEAAVKAGEFRADLYFRLRVIELTVPPLRERRDDIMMLADHFLKQFREEIGSGPTGFSERSKKAMHDYQWPGNIRELRNAVERAVVLASGELAEPEDLALSNLVIPGGAASPAQYVYHELSLEELERRHILATLEATGGHKSRSAAILGIERSTLDRKLKKYLIESSGDD